VQLLRDIRRVFVGERTASVELVSRLCALEESSWGGYSREWSPSFDPRSLAKLLKPCSIGPRALRFGNGTKNGYLWSAFEDAWERYLTPEEVNTLNTPNDGAANPVGDVGDVDLVDLPEEQVSQRVPF
jgi:Protein of unknown function (DUF3631)